MTEKEKIDLWIDLHTARMAAQNFPEGTRDSIERVFIGEIASHFGMGTEEVYSFIEALQDRPEEMMHLYNAAIDSVNALDRRYKTNLPK